MFIQLIINTTPQPDYIMEWRVEVVSVKEVTNVNLHLWAFVFV